MLRYAKMPFGPDRFAPERAVRACAEAIGGKFFDRGRLRTSVSATPIV
jgi:hypothetical protein